MSHKPTLIQGAIYHADPTTRLWYETVGFISGYVEYTGVVNQMNGTLPKFAFRQLETPCRTMFVDIDKKSLTDFLGESA